MWPSESSSLLLHSCRYSSLISCCWHASRSGSRSLVSAWSAPGHRTSHYGGILLAIGLMLAVGILPVWGEGWRTVGGMTTVRAGHSSTLLSNGKVLVAGGRVSGAVITSSAEIYDPATGSWSATGSLGSARGYFAAVLLPSGKVLVVGGIGSSAILSSAEIYDPATGTWSGAGSLATARLYHTATLLRNGKVLVVAGEGVSSGKISTAEIYDPATGTWSATGSLTSGRIGHTATLLSDGRVLVAGGAGSGGYLSSVEIYDPATGSWSSTGSMVTARRQHTAILLADHRVLVAGGYNSGGTLSSAEIYNPATGAWSATSGMGTPRNSHTATLLPNGRMLVAGGMSGSALSSAEIYDPSDGNWSAAGSLANARYWHSATLLASGEVLVAGGQGSYLSSAEIYEYAGGTWSVTGSVNIGRDDHSATILPSGEVLVAGGDGTLGETLSSAEIYNPATGTWRITGNLNGARSWHIATLLPNGKVLVTGGPPPTTLNSAELYDPATGTWSYTGNVNQGRVAGHTATLMPNGKVLITGGIGLGVVDPGSTEIYDPETGTWSATGSLRNGRFGHTATLLLNGKVLVTGGAGSRGYLASAEIYDPAGGTWSDTGDLNNGRYQHCATLLSNGKVLVTGGGVGNGAEISSSAEMYDPETGTWSTTGSLAIPRKLHTATLLPNGKVLVAGGYENLSSAEIYDPDTGIWRDTANLNSNLRTRHTATLLPNGKVLVVGGDRGQITPDPSAELYDTGLGYQSGWQPVLTSATSPVTRYQPITLTGSGFRGISEASGGNSVQNASTGYPLVQLLSLSNEQTLFMQPETGSWSDTFFKSMPLANFPIGHALLTVFANGIPGTSRIIVLNFTGNPFPGLTSLNPASATIPASGFNLTLTGDNFIPGSVVRWNGSDRATIFVSSTQLTAAILSTDVAVGGVYSVTVFNPSPGGGISVGLAFTVVNPAPAIQSISPTGKLAGSGAFTLSITGSNFVSGSKAQWNGTDRSTTYVSASQLTAAISAGDVAAGGVVSVSVVNPAPGGGTSNSQAFTISNPVPSITSITPESVFTQGAAFTLTVMGANFVNTSIVRWNGADRTTTFVSSSQLKAAIPASDIANSGSGSITVFNPPPAGGTSGTVSLPITNPVPTLTRLGPSSASASYSGFTMDIEGANFVPNSVARWNGSDRTTGFFNSAYLQAYIPETDITTGGSASITVFNPGPGGGVSNTLGFAISNPVPAISEIVPTNALAGSEAFTLHISGGAFVGNSRVQWNGADRPTTFVDRNHLAAAISAADIATPGSAVIRVVNPPPGGGSSNEQVFTINNPAPVLSGILPTLALAGSAGFTLQADGANLVTSSVVRWNGSDRATIFVSSTRLTATIPASDIAAGGTRTVTIFTPVPGGGSSSGATFTINNPVPVITKIVPSAAVVRDPALSLRIDGSGFTPDSVVHWYASASGLARPTTFVSSTRLVASIGNTDLQTVGNRTVTVVNADPGGGTSNVMTFTVVADTGISWRQKAPLTDPPPRTASAMAFDAVQGQVVLFGGMRDSTFLGDTWTWNGSDWTQVFPAVSPEPRAAAASSFDETRRQMVLFGGQNASNVYGDTWIWDGVNWINKTPESSPPPTLGGTAAYDALINRIVMFGGLDGYYSQDTWVWTGNLWAKLLCSVSPAARAFASMAYDSARREIVLFGGQTNSFFTDTWIFGTPSWWEWSWVNQSLAGAPPPGAVGASLGYDPVRAESILVGVTPTGEATWSWNGVKWTQETPSVSPPAGTSYPMVYDGKRRELVLLDGNGDTWVLPSPQSAGILWQNSSTGAISSWKMNGHILHSFKLVQPTISDPNWQIVGTGDFNGDGNSDILWRNQQLGKTIVWLMNGSTLDQWHYVLPDISSDWNIVGVGDFQGDGDSDILWHNKLLGMTTVWFMNGWTLNEWGSVLPAPSSDWQIAGVGDFNGDKKADILWSRLFAISQQDQVYQCVVWSLRGAQLDRYEWVTGNLYGGWEIAGVGDFDGDGGADILWRHPTSGCVLWLMDGISRRLFAYVSPSITDSKWRIVAAPFPPIE
jgi:N-acetylneuraminic acid mutarotase